MRLRGDQGPVGQPRARRPAGADHDPAPGATVWLVRHGETEWSRSGRHTSHTDLGLTAAGRRQARHLARALGELSFARVRTSPARRALETARLAGFGQVAEPTPDLVEWSYGEYEGLTTAEIRKATPGWTIWQAGAPGGEAPQEVGQRVDRVIVEARSMPGATLLIAHAHVLRVLTARWIGLPPADGRLLVLDTGTISVLGWEREQAAILRWNERCGGTGGGTGPRTTRTRQCSTGGGRER
jgi:probable phosphoglycerate mutase